jgi:hypothetical protein
MEDPMLRSTEPFRYIQGPEPVEGLAEVLEQGASIWVEGEKGEI